jgi:hypothetical protein
MMAASSYTRIRVTLHAIAHVKQLPSIPLHAHNGTNYIMDQSA